MYLNVISAFSTIFFVFLLKYFLFSKDIWAYEVWAGVSFVVGILSTIVLDILTNPLFIMRLFAMEIKKKVDKLVDLGEKKEETEVIKEIFKDDQKSGE